MTHGVLRSIQRTMVVDDLQISQHQLSHSCSPHRSVLYSSVQDLIEVCWYSNCWPILSDFVRPTVRSNVRRREDWLLSKNQRRRSFARGVGDNTGLDLIDRRRDETTKYLALVFRNRYKELVIRFRDRIIEFVRMLAFRNDDQELSRDAGKLSGARVRNNGNG